MTERVDLDALERLIHGPKLDQFSNDDLALMLDAFHELRASRKVVEAASLVLTASDIDNLHPEIWRERLRAALAALEEPVKP